MAAISVDADPKKSEGLPTRSRRLVVSLLTSIVGVLLLQGCAPAVIKAPPRMEQNVPAGSTGTIRTLGPDHWFVPLRFGGTRSSGRFRPWS